MSQNLVSINDISHSFENLLYENVSFEIKKKQSVAILGVSGSGKSTILNSIATFLKPKTGSIDLYGYKNIYNLSQKDVLFLRRKILGVIFQSHYLFRGFNAQENLKVATIIAQSEIDTKMLEMFNIAHTMKQQIGELSGGQQQRLSIARVLCKYPKIIIADEPTGNLDTHTANIIMQYLLQYIHDNDACLVIATHDNNIAKSCDIVFNLSNQKLQKQEMCAKSN